MRSFPNAFRGVIVGIMFAGAAVAASAGASADTGQPTQHRDPVGVPVSCDPNNWNPAACLLSGSSSLSAKPK